VTFGAVPAARTVLFVTPIHSSTGSGVAAGAGLGFATMLLTSNAEIAAISRSFFMGSLLWARANIGLAKRDVKGLRLDYFRITSGLISR
jgi:hypothetical protein